MALAEHAVRLSWRTSTQSVVAIGARRAAIEYVLRRLAVGSQLRGVFTATARCLKGPVAPVLAMSSDATEDTED